MTNESDEIEPPTMDGKWFIVVADNEVGYGQDGGYEYTELVGVIGPFDTCESAHEHSRAHKLFRKHDMTEVVRLTRPGDEASIYANKYERPARDDSPQI